MHADREQLWVVLQLLAEKGARVAAEADQRECLDSADDIRRGLAARKDMQKQTWTSDIEIHLAAFCSTLVTVLLVPMLKDMLCKRAHPAAAGGAAAAAGAALGAAVGGAAVVGSDGAACPD